MPLNAYWLIRLERIGRGPYVTTISLFANVLFIIVVFSGLNLLAKRLWKPLFSAADLGVLYSLLALSSALAGMDDVEVLVQVMSVPYYFGQTNHWLQNFGDYLSPWLIVDNRDALLGFFRGNSSLYTWQHLHAWLKPALVWTGLWTLIFWAGMALNSLLAPRWLKREKLTYPIVQVPLELIQRPESLWRNKTMWLGFALSGGLGVLNGFNFLFPAVPALHVLNVDLGQLIRTHPWNAIGWTPVTFYPFVIGLGFLIPTDLLFSCWFFFWVWKGQQVLAAATGLNQVPDAPWITQQTFGAVLGLAFALLWSSRFELAESFQRTAHYLRQHGVEWPLKPRLAWTILLGCLAALILVWHLFGMRWWLAAFLFVGYYLMAVTVTRIRAEFGSPVHDFHWVTPDYMIVSVLGSHSFTKSELVGLGYFWSFNRAQRSNPLPQHAESFKVAEQTRLPLARMQKLAMFTVPFAVLTGIWAFCHLGYSQGAASKFAGGIYFGIQDWNRTDSWVRVPGHTDPRAFWAILVGLVSVLTLYLAKMRIVGWPFHPIGYTVSSSWSINLIWLPLLIAWLAKVLIMRHGGLRSFRAARPFFVGLILGDTLVGCLWSLVGVFTGLKVYSFWGL